jgi:Cu-Zn family superoxide dismutase
VQSGAKVMVSGEVRGLKPNAEHGFHVHEKGDCSSPDGMSNRRSLQPAAPLTATTKWARTTPATCRC